MAMIIIDDNEDVLYWKKAKVEKKKTLSNEEKDDIRYNYNPNLQKWKNELTTNKLQYKNELTKYKEQKNKTKIASSFKKPQFVIDPFKKEEEKETTIEKSDFLQQYEKLQEKYDMYNVDVTDEGKINLNDFQIKSLSSIYKSNTTDLTSDDILTTNYTDETKEKLSNEMDYLASQSANQIISDIKAGKIWTEDVGILWDALEGRLTKEGLDNNKYWRTKIEDVAKQYQIEHVTDANKAVLNTALTVDATVGSAYRGYYNSKIANAVGDLITAGKYDEANEYIKNNPMLLNVYDEYRSEGFDVDTPEAYKRASGVSELVGQIGAQTTDPLSAATTVIGTTAGAMIGGIPGAISGAKLGATAGSAANAYSIETGFAYIEMIDSGVEPDIARKMSMGVGTVNAALEFMQFKTILGFLGEETTSLTTKQIIKNYMRETLKNSVQEVAQEGTTVIGTNLGKYYSDIPLDTWDVVTNRLIETGKDSFITFLLFQAPSSISQYSQLQTNSQGQAILNTSQFNEYNKKVNEMVNDSKNQDELNAVTVIIDSMNNKIELNTTQKQKIANIILQKENTFKTEANEKAEKVTETKTTEGIETEINKLSDELTQLLPTDKEKMNEIYNKINVLRNKRDKINEQMSENKKIEKTTILQNQVDSLNSIPADKFTKKDEVILLDKSSQVQKLTNEIEKNKKIKTITNKQYVKENKDLLFDGAQAILDEINKTKKENEKPAEILTELTEEQKQLTDFGSIFGKQIVFTKNLPFSGLTSANNEKILFIDTKARNPLIDTRQNNATMLYVTGHELFHSLKQTYPDTYTEFVDYVSSEIDIQQIVNFMKKYDPNDSQNLLKQLKIDGKFDLNQVKTDKETYALQNQALNAISEEMVANEFGGMLTDKQYLTDLRNKNNSLFNKMIDAIRTLFESITSPVYDSELTQLQIESIRDTFEKTILETKEQKTTKETTDKTSKLNQKTKEIKETKETNKVENLSKIKEKTEIKTEKGDELIFKRFHPNSELISSDYAYDQDNASSQKTGYGLAFRTDELYTKNKKETDIIQTPLITRKGMLQNNNEVFNEKTVDKLNAIAKKHMNIDYNYFGTNEIMSNDLITAINNVSEMISSEKGNPTARKAWVEFYDTIGRDGYILDDEDGNKTAVIVDPDQMKNFNDIVKNKKIQTKDMKITKMSIDDRYKHLAKTFNRYLIESDNEKKKSLLSAIKKQYKNYKKDGGLETFVELEQELQTANKEEFMSVMKEKLTVKQLPKIEETKESKFYSNTVNKSALLDDILEAAKTNPKLKEYTITSHNKDIKAAIQKLKDDPVLAIDNFYHKKRLDSVDTQLGKILMTYYRDKKDINSEIAIYNRIKEEGTKSGQYIESLKVFKELSPVAIVQSVKNDLLMALDELQSTKDPTLKTWLKQNYSSLQLTDAEQEWIYQVASKAETMDPDSYEYKRAYAMIHSLVAGKIPKSVTAKLKAFRRISMLFNPKTLTRNFLGNEMVQPINKYVVDSAGAIVDKSLSKLTGLRTTGFVSNKAFKEGKKIGKYEAKQDRLLGINTTRANPFERQQGKTFSDKNVVGKTLNFAEKWMNYGLDLGDRPFEEAYYNNSLMNQMMLNEVAEPTETMKQIALYESQKRTWKNNGKLARKASEVRSILNTVRIGDLGLGDLVLPFILTPSNLAVAIYEYSPAELVSVVKNAVEFKSAVKKGENVAISQKMLADSIGKATAGFALYALGYALAANGITSGGEDDDYEVRQMMRAMGFQDYSIQIGDHTFSYDWAQPVASAFATTAELYDMLEEGKRDPNSDIGNNTLKLIAEAFTIGGDRLYEQSFLSSVNDILSATTLQEGLTEFGVELPQSFVPTLFKQIADVTEGNIKATYDPNNLLNTLISKAMNKIPGVKSLLPDKKNVFGESIESYGGYNNAFNVFINPSNISANQAGEIGQEIMDVYNHTGDASVMPNTADYSMKYDINDDGELEKITFDTKQQSKLQEEMGTILNEGMLDLINEDMYINASYEDKAIAIASLVDYSKAKAIEQSGFVKNYEIKTGNASQINNYMQKGLSISESVMYDSLISQIKPLKDEQGVTIDGSLNGQKAYNIMNMKISDESKNTMLQLISPTSKNPETVDSLTALSSEQSYIEYYSLPSHDVFVIQNFSRDDYDTATEYFNFTGSNYISYTNELASIKSDYDTKGNVISGSKKQKTISYINSLPINQYQKIMLYSSAGYSVKQWNNDLYSYINSLNVSADKKQEIWSYLGLD